MKRLFLLFILALSLPSWTFAGTNAAITFRTNDLVVAPSGIWASNAAAISSAVAGSGQFISAGYNNFPTNWVCYGDSWSSAIDGNSGALDTNTAWTYQAMRKMGWNFTNYAVAGNGVAGNVNLLFSNSVASNQAAIFALVQNDTANNAAIWGMAELAQLMRLCFATNDPGLRTAVQITNGSPTNGNFYGAWTRTPNAPLQGYGCNVNGAGLVMTNLFGSSIAVCVDGFTNGTGADFVVTLDGGAPMIYHSEIAGYVSSSVPYASNSIPIVPVTLTGLSPIMHTLAITNFGTGANTNLNVNYIVAADMRQSSPMVVAVGGAVDPPNGNLYGGTAGLNGALRTNVFTLNAMGLPAWYFPTAGLVPYGPHGTASTLHLAPYEATNIANGFLRTLLLSPPQSMAPANLYLYNASQGVLGAPISIPGLGQFSVNPYIQLGLQNFPFYISDQTGTGQLEFDGGSVLKIYGGSGLYLNPGSSAGLSFLGSTATFTGTVNGNGAGLTNLAKTNLAGNTIGGTPSITPISKNIKILSTNLLGGNSDKFLVVFAYTNPISIVGLTNLFSVAYGATLPFTPLPVMSGEGVNNAGIVYNNGGWSVIGETNTGFTVSQYLAVGLTSGSTTTNVGIIFDCSR